MPYSDVSTLAVKSALKKILAMFKYELFKK